MTKSGESLDKNKQNTGFCKENLEGKFNLSQVFYKRKYSHLTNGKCT